MNEARHLAGEAVSCNATARAGRRLVGGHGHITGWTWRPVPEPKLTVLAPRGQAWELTRYQAYQAQLAGHTIGETFTRAAAFLQHAVADAPALTDG